MDPKTGEVSGSLMYLLSVIVEIKYISIATFLLHVYLWNIRLRSIGVYRVCDQTITNLISYLDINKYGYQELY